jgi:hypothetical protein
MIDIPFLFEVKAMADKSSEKILCPDCEVEPGKLHEFNCTKEQCAKCGGQWITCGHQQNKKRVRDSDRIPWSGQHYGVMECIELRRDCLGSRVLLALHIRFRTSIGSLWMPSGIRRNGALSKRPKPILLRNPPDLAIRIGAPVNQCRRRYPVMTSIAWTRPPSRLCLRFSTRPCPQHERITSVMSNDLPSSTAAEDCRPVLALHTTPPTVELCRCCNARLHRVIVTIVEGDQDYASGFIYLCQQGGFRVATVNIYFGLDQSSGPDRPALLIAQQVQVREGKLEFVLCDPFGEILPSAFRAVSKEEAVAHMDALQRVNELIRSSDPYTMPFVRGTWTPAPEAVEEQASEPEMS